MRKEVVTLFGDEEENHEEITYMRNQQNDIKKGFNDMQELFVIFQEIRTKQNSKEKKKVPKLQEMRVDL